MCEHSLHAQASDFLVGDTGDDDITAQTTPCGLRGRPQAGGDTALHVVGAAPVELAGLDAPAKRLRHARHADRVDVPIQHKGAPSTRPARDGHDAGTSRDGLNDVDVEARTFRPGGDKAGDVAFARRAGHEIRVDRINPHKVGE